MRTAARKAVVDVLERAPMRRAQYRLWGLASGGTFLGGFSIFVLGVALPLVEPTFRLGPGELGLLTAAVLLGAVFGSALGGVASDRFGRRPLLLADMALVVPAGVAGALAPTAVVLLGAQFALGVGIGIDFPVGGSYVSELMPARHRSRMMVATIACQSVGMLAGAAYSIAVLHLFPGPDAWRGLFAGPGIVGALVLLGRLSLPESPRWLAGRGRSGEAVAVIARLAPDEAEALERLAAAAGEGTPYRDRPEEGQGASIGALFGRAYLRRTALVAVPWLLMDVAAYGVGIFTPVLLGVLDRSGHRPGTLAAEFADATGSGFIDLFLLVGFAAGLWLVPRLGRIRAQIMGFAGMTAGMLVLLLAVRLGGGAGAHLVLVLAGFTIFNLFMNAGPNSTTFSLAPELFPTRLRATASGFAASAAKLGATLGVFSLPTLREAWGVSAVLALMATASALGLLTTWLLGRGVAEAPALDDEEPVAAPAGPR